MVDFKSRRHRLELPSIPASDDPAVLKRAMDQMKRLVQDEFNRLATDFYDFKKTTYDAAIIPLRGVANIAVTADEYSMSATWELPDGDEITPTHVRVRILEISPNSWALYSYPKTSWEFNGLTPGTQYTFQVQLVATFEATDSFISTTRNCPSVPVLRTAESDVRSKVFTTVDGVGPPTDGGTNDTNITFNFPNTQGTPGTVGGSDCWWEYKIQYRAACAWVDTGAGGAEVDGNVGDVVLDTAAAPFTTYSNAIFRLAYREVCNSIDGEWVYGEGFMAVDYSDPDCLGIVKSDSLTTDPFDTADLFALPSACQASGTNLQIVDALSDAEFLPLEPGFKCIEYDSGEWTIFADDTTDPAISPTIYQSLLTGTIPAVANLTDVSDFVINFDIKIADNSLVLAGGTGPYEIVNVGDKIKFFLIENLSTFSIQVSIPRDGGGAYVFRADNLGYGSWHNVYYSHEVASPTGRRLIVDNTLAGQSTNAFLNDFNGITDVVEVNCVNDMAFRSFYGWKSLVNLEITWGSPELIGTDVQSNSTTTLTFNVPVGVASGDVAVALLSVSSSQQYTGTGWISYGLVNSNGHQILYYVCDGSESGTFPALTCANSNAKMGVLGLWRGLDTSDPLDHYSRTAAAQIIGDTGTEGLNSFTDPTVSGAIQWAITMVPGTSTNVPQLIGEEVSGWKSAFTPTARAASLYRTRLFPTYTPTNFDMVNGTNQWYIDNIIGSAAGQRYFQCLTLNPATAFSGLTLGTISHVGSNSASGTSTNPTVSLPSGVEEGDYVFVNFVTSINWAAGDDVNEAFLQNHRITDNSNPRYSFNAGAIIPVGAGVPASISITKASSTWRAIISVYRGVDPTCPVDFYGPKFARDDDQTQPACTTQFDGSWIISSLGSYRTSGTVLPRLPTITANGYTAAVAPSGAVGKGVDNFIYHYEQASAGTPPVLGMSAMTGSRLGIWSVVALRPKNSVPA